MWKSFGVFFLGIIKRLYWVAPSLFLDPFDFAERYFGVEKYVMPQYLAWLCFSFGIMIAAALTYHELRVERDKLKMQLLKPILFIRSSGFPRMAKDYTQEFQRFAMWYVRWTPSLGQDRGYVKIGSHYPQGVRC